MARENNFNDLLFFIAVAREQSDGACELLLVNFALDQSVQVFQTIAGEADSLGLRRGKRGDGVNWGMD